jgi:UDP-2,3-diacylglucosamine hydrolase
LRPVAAYFASDIHLRIDRPDRSGRFARWVQSLSPSDSLTIVGDLCDFWFASRQARREILRCEGLLALIELIRRGGSVTVLAGNHDTWLGAFYQETLGVRWVEGSLDLEACGLRIHCVHGHLLGARSAWKGLMEGQAFLQGFGKVPEPLAVGLERVLDWKNERGRAASERRHLAVYRRYSDELADRADVVVFGHIHRTHDDNQRAPRMVVLGDWLDGMSYLVVDQDGARLIRSGP